jgi:hypothetical protein
MRPPSAFAPAESDERTPNDERRAVVRYRTALAVPLHPVGKPPTKEARVRDVSIFGIGLHLDETVELSTLLEIELRTPRQALVRTVFARVVHVESITAGGWIVGCAFVGELPEKEMHLFRAERRFAHEQDSRRWVRFPCDLETVCYTSETAPGERHTARIINVSPGGVGVLLRCEFGVGTLLYLDLPPELAHPQPRLLVRVVRVMEHSPGNWFLGCEFAHQLMLKEIKALVANPPGGSR